MHVLLTGAAGFIGSSLAERLVARGDRVVGLDNFDETLYGRPVKERNLRVLLATPGRFRFVEGDILDERVRDALLGERPDVVVHLAALAGVRPSLQKPQRYQRVNADGTLDLLESCRMHDIRRFVFASSSSVYGAHDRTQAIAFREDDPAVRPASPYAATKRAGELWCSTYSDLFGIATPSLRFFTVYGPRQRPEMAIHKFTRLIDEGRPVPFFGDGTSARDYTYVDDILDGVLAAIDRAGTLPAPHRVYNLGGSRTTTLARLVSLIEQALGKRAVLDRQPEQPGDVPITCADTTRSTAELHYRPLVPIEEGIQRFVKWYREVRR